MAMHECVRMNINNQHKHKHTRKYNTCAAPSPPYNAAKCELPIPTRNWAWTHKNKRKLRAKIGRRAGRRGGAGQLGRCTAELRLILNYDSLFAFMAKHLQLKRFSRTLSRALTNTFSLSVSLSLFVPAKSSLCCSRTHRLGLMQNTGQGHKLN